MLAPVRLAEQWREIRAELPSNWSSSRLSLTLSEDSDADRAALILASLTPGRLRSSFRLEVRPDRDPENVFERLDREGFRGLLTALRTEEAPAAARRPAAPVPVAATPRAEPLAEQWERLVSDLPPDWSDLWADVELASSDFVQRGALLLAPVNPARHGGPTTLRFRSARQKGYGVAPEMARRCFERCDAEEITGKIRILRVLSDTSLVSTQGPVWRLGGRSL
jgi:hypothetical protein